MSGKNYRFYKIIIHIFITAYLVLGCQVFNDAREQHYDGDINYYKIDVSTIQDTLIEGKTDVFTALAVVPNGTPLTLEHPLNWSSNDYYRIATTLLVYTTHEQLSTWHLSNMMFRMLCADVKNGPQEAEFTFFKTFKIKEKDSRFVVTITIEPWRMWSVFMRGKITQCYQTGKQ